MKRLVMTKFSFPTLPPVKIPLTLSETCTTWHTFNVSCAEIFGNENRGRIFFALTPKEHRDSALIIDDVLRRLMTANRSITSYHVLRHEPLELNIKFVVNKTHYFSDAALKMFCKVLDVFNIPRHAAAHFSLTQWNEVKFKGNTILDEKYIAIKHGLVSK